jgi:hypothetical protein
MYAELLQVVDEEGLDKLQMIGDFNKLQVLMEEPLKLWLLIFYLDLRI